MNDLDLLELLEIPKLEELFMVSYLFLLPWGFLGLLIPMQCEPHVLLKL